MLIEFCHAERRFLAVMSYFAALGFTPADTRELLIIEEADRFFMARPSTPLNFACRLHKHIPMRAGAMRPIDDALPAAASADVIAWLFPRGMRNSAYCVTIFCLRVMIRLSSAGAPAPTLLCRASVWRHAIARCHRRRSAELPRQSRTGLTRRLVLYQTILFRCNVTGPVSREVRH